MLGLPSVCLEYTYDENEDIMNEIDKVDNMKDDDLDEILDGSPDFRSSPEKRTYRKRRRPPVPTPRDGTGTGSAPKPSAGTIGHQSKLPKDLDWNDILNEKRLGRLDALEERQQWVPKRNRSHFNYRNPF